MHIVKDTLGCDEVRDLLKHILWNLMGRKQYYLHGYLGESAICYQGCVTSLG